MKTLWGKLLCFVFLLVLAVVLGGCMEVDQGLVIDNTGIEMYYGSKVKSEEVEGVENFSYDLPGFSINAFHDMDIHGVFADDEYIGLRGKCYFKDIGDLAENIGNVQVITDQGSTVINLTLEEKDANGRVHKNDGFLGSLCVVENNSCKFNFAVCILNGDIIESNGSINGNKVTWDVIKELEKDNKLLSIKYSGNKNDLEYPNGAGSDKWYGVEEAPIDRGKEASDVFNGVEDNIEVTIFGKKVEFTDQKAIIQNNRVLVPLRIMAENFSTEIVWDPPDAVELVFEDKRVNLTCGVKEIDVINNEDINKLVFDTAPCIINGRMMIPLRALAEIFEKDVLWDNGARTVTVSERPCS